MSTPTLGWRGIVEVVTLLAVVGGFVAVVQELRQTRAALAAQSYQARTLETIEMSWQIINGDDDFLNLVNEFERGGGDIESLSAVERMKLRRFFHMRRSDTDNEHYMFENGFLDPDFYYTTTVRDIKRMAPNWRRFGINEPREAFREEVDRILADPSISIE